MDKKIFSINGVQYSIVAGSRNYLEYQVPVRNGKAFQRKRIYKGFQQVNSLDQLYDIAIKHIAWLTDQKAQDIKPASKLHEYLINNRYRYKPRTYDLFNRSVTAFCDYCFRNKIRVPHAVTVSQCNEYLTRYSSGKMNGTIYNHQLILTTVFNGLVRDNAIKENPWSLLPKVKRSATSLMYFTKSQRKIIRDHVRLQDSQLYRAILLVFSAAIRPNELRSIRVMDLCLEDNYVQLIAQDTKNSKASKVTLSKQVCESLDAVVNFPPHYFIFSRSGTPGPDPVGPNYLNNKHREFLKELKITGRYALYSWKHTGAVAMVEAGIHIKQIQLHFRHSSLDMTNEYLKNLGVNDLNIQDKLPEL